MSDLQNQIKRFTGGDRENAMNPEERLKWLNELHQVGNHTTIVAAVEALPAGERDFELTGLYARALNNLDREADGLAALLPFREEGKDDGLWNYRMSYSLFYTGRKQEALEYIRRAIKLGDRDTTTYGFLHEIERACGQKPSVFRCAGCGREISFEGICYYCRCKAERERYQNMSAEEIARTVREIIDGIETIREWDKAYKDFCGLLSCRDINTESIAAAAFVKGIYYPHRLYRNASLSVRDGMIALLRQPDCADANNMLGCLAVIGDDAVVAAFKRLDADPPDWLKRLHWNAEQYLLCGDMCLDGGGKPVKLSYEQCYALLPGTEQDSAVKVAVPRDDVCGHCGCRLMDILIIDGRDGRLSFLGLDGTVRIPICPNCATMCEKTVVRYTLDGDSRMETIEPLAKGNYVRGDGFQKTLAVKGTRAALLPSLPRTCRHRRRPAGMGAIPAV
jgi:hypothetical protein